MFTIPPLSSDILAINLDGKGSPLIKANVAGDDDGSHAYGWGVGWYPSDHASAAVMKDPAARGEQVLLETIADWSNFRSTTFFCKVRGAAKGYRQTDAQPFVRSFAGRDWLFMHNGDLDKDALEALHGRKSRLLEPLGNTDSELAFCNLLSRMYDGAARRIADIDPGVLHAWLKSFDSLGSADMVLSDGESMLFFHSTQSPKPMYHARIQPPDNQDIYISDAAQFSLGDPRDAYRTAFVVSSAPFSGSVWMRMQPGQVMIVRRGAVVWDSAPEYRLSVKSAPLSSSQSQQATPFMMQSQAEQSQDGQALGLRPVMQAPEGVPLNYLLYDVSHITRYEYTEPVQHSTHFFRLQPTNDLIQKVVKTTLKISSPGEETRYEDVFGNQSMHVVINDPYAFLTVEATSRVKVFATNPDDHSLSRRQSSIPLGWMPWQRQMMMPYLLPSELPESQLMELTEYAMSFVERNDYHLMNTIEDINLSIYRDYQYVSGSTSLNTTPFEVYTLRKGVCQDFANLFICLARLLSIPSRYRMGYIYTGANYANKIQSDASHAWAEVYLPYVGWRGFDPTNGCAVLQDHIRVACGRNYRDATPTAGTIYKGGGTETLTVDVKMRKVIE